MVEGEEYYDEQDADIETSFAMEDQQEQQADAYDDLTPQYSDKDDLYSLFWKVVKTGQSSKVGNLDMKELGILNISVRDCQKIALLARTLNHPGFAYFFDRQAEIILATSASKEGWLPNLFVSQNVRRQSTRIKALEPTLPQYQQRQLQEGSQEEAPHSPSQPRTKKGLFGKR